MGLPAARLGDIGSNHICHYPPSPAIEDSLNVVINGHHREACDQLLLNFWITSMIESSFIGFTVDRPVTDFFCVYLKAGISTYLPWWFHGVACANDRSVICELSKSPNKFCNGKMFLSVGMNKSLFDRFICWRGFGVFDRMLSVPIR